MRRFSSRRRPLLSGSLLLSILALSACAPPAGSPVARQLSRGQVIYEQGCATEACHGANGEGLKRGSGFRVWPLVGEEFQSRNPTAQVIFDVVRSGGEPSLRALTDQQVYDAIAYELTLNKVELAEPLDSLNAPGVSSGASAAAEPGKLFPPPGNAQIIPAPQTPALPASAENGELRLRLTQMARATFIGETVLPAGGSFVLVVFTLEALSGHPLEVGPGYLRLVTEDGQMLEPQEMDLSYPVARFGSQTIQPEHGAAALAIFSVPDSAQIRHLRYTTPNGEDLVVEVSR